MNFFCNILILNSDTQKYIIYLLIKMASKWKLKLKLDFYKRNWPQHICIQESNWTNYFNDIIYLGCRWHHIILYIKLYFLTSDQFIVFKIKIRIHCNSGLAQPRSACDQNWMWLDFCFLCVYKGVVTVGYKIFCKRSYITY